MKWHLATALGLVIASGAVYAGNGLSQWDTDGDDRISEGECSLGIDNNDGYIDEDEMQDGFGIPNRKSSEY